MHVELPDDALSQLSRSVFALNGILLGAGESLAKPLGLSVAKWHVLGRANEARRTVAQIARFIGVSRQSVQRIANDLEREGLVEFTRHATDARTQLVMLTAEGKARLTQLYERDKVWSEGALSRLDPATILQLSIQLDEVSAVIARYSEESLCDA